MEIEAKSFEIITEECKERKIEIPEDVAFLVKRCIHTTADFEYAETMRFSEDAIPRMAKLIREGAHIVTDTNMALSGINKRVLAEYGGEVHCFMADADVAAEAKERGVTRATVSMERAAKLPNKVIFAIGNAPTALLNLREMYDRGEFRPEFVIGVPVGFVNVVAAKEMVMETDIPYIINAGRKGGSNVAAAICNAVLYEMKKGNL
jgi:precorrin-8X/cobalt-precorrin-8 methylmutase